MNILLLLQICIVSLCFSGGNSLVGASTRQQPQVTLKFTCGNSGQYDLNAVLCMKMIEQNLDGCGVNMEKVHTISAIPIQLKKDEFDKAIGPLLSALATNNNDVNECKNAVLFALSQQTKHNELALKIDYLFYVLGSVNSLNVKNDMVDVTELLAEEIAKELVLLKKMKQHITNILE